jgi:GR25 family glycosyltransferase involved in LPS biosynthesis
MFDKLDIAVINLDRRPDRMAYIHKSIPFLYNPMMRHHFTSSSMTRPMRMNTGIFASRGGYRRFSAIDGQNIAKYYPEFDWLLDTVRDSSRVLGEVGCSLSHYSLWKGHVVAPNADYLLVFEDDVLFTDASHERMKDVLCELERRGDGGGDAWDVLYVGGQWTPNYDIDGEKTYFSFQRTTRESLDTYYSTQRASDAVPASVPASASASASALYKRRNLSSAVLQGNRNVWFTPLFRTAGAYLISQRGAKRLLEAVETDTALFMKTPLDMWLLEMDFRGYIDVFDRFPHPFYQAGFELVKEPSHIQNDIHRTDFQPVRIPASSTPNAPSTH